MQRRINEANRHRKSVHGFKYPDEVPSLERKKFIERSNAVFPVVCQDHLLNSALPLVAFLRLLEVCKKHVLCPAQPNTRSAKLARLASVLGSVGVRAHP